MLTPIFNLSQDNRFLIIKIRAPHAKLTEAEISYDSNCFLFNANPYFLRLFLTGEVIDDETGTCHFDSDKEEFTICAPKKNPGEHFPRLEMLSELIKPQQKAPDAQRLVEIVGTNTLRNQNEKENKPIEKSEMHELDDENGSDEEEATIKDELLYAAQQIHKSNETFPDEEIIAKFGYGFGWVRNRVLGRFSDEIIDLIDLDDPENVLIDARTTKLREFDEKHFQEQHYLADLFSPEPFHLDAMEFVLDQKEHLSLTEEDLIDLKDLKSRQLEQFTSEITEQIGLSLVDILFGFHYDFRTTLGDHSVESGWTISKLSPSLTFLLRWPNMRTAIISTIRHSLVVPLIRNWDLAVKVLGDVYITFKHGRPAILHCLLACRRIFNRGGEFRYLFNQLFLDDFCLWIQTVPDELLLKLKADLKREKRTLKKEDMLELDLEFLEAHARLEMLKPLDSDDDEKVE